MFFPLGWELRTNWLWQGLSVPCLTHQGSSCPCACCTGLGPHRPTPPLNCPYLASQEVSCSMQEVWWGVGGGGISGGSWAMCWAHPLPVGSALAVSNPVAT